MESSVKSFMNAHKEFSDANINENLKNSIDKIKNFYIVILSYIICSLVFFISLAVAIYYIYKSLEISCEFFIITIPVIVIIILYGIKKSVNDLVTGINELLEYILEFTNLYFKDQEKNAEKDIPPAMYVIQVLFSLFLIPVIKNIINSRFLGGFVISYISKRVEKFCVEIEEDNESEISQRTTQASDSVNNYEKAQIILSNINKFKIKTKEKSDKYLRRFKFLINFISILSLVLGIPLMIIIVFILRLLL